MSADDKARKLAEKMAQGLLTNTYEARVAALLPYATAFLAAEEAVEKYLSCVRMYRPEVTHELICNWMGDDGRSQYCNCGWNNMVAALSTIKGLL